MKSLIRWLGSSAIGALVTFCLFVLMYTLISADFQLQEKKDKLSFEIATKVEDIKIVERQTNVAKVRKVITPPPPPTIARQAATQPTVAIASLEGAIPEFEAPKLDRESFKIRVSDRDAQPLVRIPPQMPPRAEKSGHCEMRFDVSPEGAPFNVVATYCTSSVFKRSSIRNVQRWKYNPKIVDGRAVSRTGVVTRIRYDLVDDRGNIIPE